MTINSVRLEHKVGRPPLQQVQLQSNATDPFRRAARYARCGRQGRSFWAAISQESVTTAPLSTNAHDVEAVLFDMDGVLCDSEKLSRSVGATVLQELYGLQVSNDDFVPFVGTGEANFLGGVARKHGVDFDATAAKARFFELYCQQAARSESQIAYTGALQLVRACRAAGLKTAVASSADRVKVDANLTAAGFNAASDFDAVVSADAFERLKPAPDVFLAAAAALGVHPRSCVVLEDAPAGVQAARAAGMRCIGVATTLSEQEMVWQKPDAVRSSIAAISLDDITAIPGGIERLASHSEASTSAASSETQEAWLDAKVQLPLGYRTSRRELLKLLPLVGAAGAGYSLLQNVKTLSYVSPRALLRALSPDRAPQSAPGQPDDRVAAFKRYIASKEARGGMEAVPDFQPGLTWFNAPPLSLNRELRGKVLVYDFWTYCCINCIHVLPGLAALEASFRDQPFAVVGVHSAKFDNEKDDESIRSAILRYEIRHACVNDGEMALWRQLGISSWPTLAVVSPGGRLIAALPGEGQEDTVDAFVRAALEFYGDRGELDAKPLPLALEADKDSRVASTQLRFPGKLAADVAGNRLFISDSNHNRIVVTDLEGRFQDEIGGNGPRLADGDYGDAAFRRPQGVAYSRRLDALFVADTENHALRRIDLRGKRVTTLAGNGVKGSDYRGGIVGRNQQLNSPWDVALSSEEDKVYVALAGQHQIWVHDIATGATASFSGDGSERNANGRAGQTAWAQPSGLSLAPDGARLWVADSESSSVRALALDDRSSQGFAGGDPSFSENLFRFGDRDGRGSGALLQHPLAVLSLPNGTVLVADSYNHKLKVLDPQSGDIRAVAGSGRAGFADGQGVAAALSEPAGLALGPDGAVFVADTNNGVIRELCPTTGELSTLKLSGVPAPRAVLEPLQDADDVPAGASLVAINPVKASNGKLQISIGLPEGYHLTKGANTRFEVVFDVPFLHDLHGTSVVKLSHMVSAQAQRSDF